MAELPPYNPRYVAFREKCRFTVPADWKLPWFKEAQDSAFVPLVWKRPVALPPSMGLEAWYLWDAVLDDSDWITWPGHIRDAAGDDGVPGDEINDRRSQIYPAKIQYHKSQWRVSSGTLLQRLVILSGRHVGDILVHRETQGLSIWTPDAYQTHFSSVA